MNSSRLAALLTASLRGPRVAAEAGARVSAAAASVVVQRGAASMAGSSGSMSGGSSSGAAPCLGMESEMRAKWRAKAESSSDTDSNGLLAEHSLRYQTAMAAGYRSARAKQYAVLGTPATLESAMEVQDAAVVVTQARRPFAVVHVNSKWTELCGWESDEIVGTCGLDVLQGPGTSQVTLRQIESAVEEGEVLRTQLLNYRKDGTPFFNRLQVSPLFDDAGRMTHVLGMLESAT